MLRLNIFYNNPRKSRRLQTDVSIFGNLQLRLNALLVDAVSTHFDNILEV